MRDSCDMFALVGSPFGLPRSPGTEVHSRGVLVNWKYYNYALRRRKVSVQCRTIVDDSALSVLESDGVFHR